MNIEEIRYLLKKGDTVHAKELAESLEKMKEHAVSSHDEAEANVLWCYEQINLIQCEYVNAFNHLKTAMTAEDEFIDDFDTPKSKEYEAAWLCLDRCDIDISYLERNYCIADFSMEECHITDILEDIQKLRPLFPYKWFLSHEMTIEKQVCNICEKEIQVRHPCGHKAGKIYQGKLCLHEITECKIIAECIVTNPFDKYTVLKESGKKYDFKVLDYIIPHIEPYSSWSYTVKE